MVIVKTKHSKPNLRPTDVEVAVALQDCAPLSDDVGSRTRLPIQISHDAYRATQFQQQRFEMRFLVLTSLQPLHSTIWILRLPLRQRDRRFLQSTHRSGLRLHIDWHHHWMRRWRRNETVRHSYLSCWACAFFCHNLRRDGGLDCGCAPRSATPLSAWVTVPLVLSPVCALLGPYYACAQNDSIPPGYAAISLGDCAFGIDLSLHLTWIGLCSRSCIQDKTAPACYASITLGDCAFGFESRLFLDAGQITQSCFCAKEGAVSF